MKTTLLLCLVLLLSACGQKESKIAGTKSKETTGQWVNIVTTVSCDDLKKEYAKSKRPLGDNNGIAASWATVTCNQMQKKYTGEIKCDEPIGLQAKCE